MRYSTVFKFIAVILCAATLLGAVGSAAGILFLTELGNKSVEEQYADQLRSRALSYGINVAEICASEVWGGAPQNLINYHWGNDWETQYFDWTKVGYTLYDSEGNVVREQEMLDGSQGIAYTFENLPVGGRYIQLISTTPREEYHLQTTEPAGTEGAEVLVMPAQGMTEISACFIDYTDGHSEHWESDAGEALGTLHYNGGTSLTFESNHIDGIPEGDGWYPNHILLLDMGGNAVYEAVDDTYVILGSEQDGAFFKIHLPAGTITASAPVGVTFSNGDYSAYDAIPTQGTTVAQMNVTYANAQGETVGSEGIASPDLIGTIFHDYQGNAEFHSTEPMTMDIPEDCIIIDITFADAQQNCIFEASCPGGVGTLTNDENGYLVFRGEIPGTVIPEEVPQETYAEEVEATEASEEPEGLTGFAREELTLYMAPSTDSKPVGTVAAWQELQIVKQDHFNSQLWGLTLDGWILMDQVLLGDKAAASEMAAEPATTSMDIPDVAAADATTAAEETIAPTQETVAPEETIAPTEETFAPQETVFPTELEVMTAPEHSDSVMESTAETVVPEIIPAATELVVSAKENVQTAVYYDSEQKQEMVAEYTMEAIPEAYTITVRLAEGALDNELGWTLLRLAEALRHHLLKVLGLCIAVFVLCIVYLCCAAARKRGSDEVKSGGLNRIPLDLYFAVDCFAVTGLVAAAMFGSEYLVRRNQQLAILFCGACAYLICLLIVGFFFAFVAQIKTPGGYWWRSSFCGWCIKLMMLGCTGAVDLCCKAWIHGKPLSIRFFRWLGEVSIRLWQFVKKISLWLWDTTKRLTLWLWERLIYWWRWFTRRLARLFGLLPITWQFLATGFILVCLLYFMMRTYKVGYILLGFGIFFAVILYAASAFGILLESAKRMSKGDLDTKVNDRVLVGGFKEFAGELNDLAGVAVIAAQKQLKSERMKTELITNVSHDIKTPLTSIINYVDLLQKPHTEQQQEQYLEVLDRQSQRLKKLIDDLMEMSKASTGNLNVDIEKVDAAEAVNQALGEFSDKLERAQLTPVFRQPDDPVAMMADGRLVWRVMSNLLSNAVKYALPGTRIYLDLLEMDGKVIISMKNISREELNVNADELMERFVRGDASRHTEGSGLGLNIAQSLMELQKGQLQILVDGDLFKVTLIFPGA